MSDLAVELTGVTKRYGDVRAVDGIDLSIADGEFFSMLGPSGSGKTTTLRLIAGFEQATAGTVKLDGADVTGKPAFLREVNTVFQDYALFPHMSVLENVAYGLRVRKVPKAQRRERAMEALSLVRLDGYHDRRPGQLSGGQRQRVALARAIVVHPKVLLLDEPLGALDMKLREQMQVELKQLQRELGITFVFVTHDQEEALTLSDRIAVFRDGKIVQLGTPAEIYQQPVNEYVATFVGTSNVLDDQTSRRLLHKPGVHALRPERISVLDDKDPAPPGHLTMWAVITERIYLGSAQRLHLQLDDGTALIARELHDGFDARGKRVRIHFDTQAPIPLSQETKE